jgi:hypothetical protein
MPTRALITIGPSHWLDPAKANEEPLTDELNVSELARMNLSKMHQHQATSQWIRTWSFALTGAFIGYAYYPGKPMWFVAVWSIIMELVLFAILVKDVSWHSPFWRYRDRVRLCEAYFIGNLAKEDFRQEYLRVRGPSRRDLLRDAFSIKKLLLINSDFVEVYLMAVIAIACMLYVSKIRW